MNVCRCVNEMCINTVVTAELVSFVVWLELTITLKQKAKKNNFTILFAVKPASLQGLHC